MGAGILERGEGNPYQLFPRQDLLLSAGLEAWEQELKIEYMLGPH